jgi:hypothetical protein
MIQPDKANKKKNRSRSSGILTKPIAYQNIKNDTVPPAFIEVW